MKVSTDAPCKDEDPTSMSCPRNCSDIRESLSSRNRLESEFHILSLPSDTLIHIWMYFSAKELEDRSRKSNRNNDGTDVSLSRDNIRLVCRQFFNLCRAKPVWQHNCQITGKLVKDDPNVMKQEIDFRALYHTIPCVGVDCPTISSALEQLKFQRRRGKLLKKNRNDSAGRSATSADHSIVTVMPGIYKESVRIEASHFKLHVPSVKGTIRDAYGDDGGNDNGNNGDDNTDDGDLISICIRAAFPCPNGGNSGVTLVYDDDHKEEDKPCINVSNDLDHYDDDPGDSSDQLCPSVYLHVEHIHFLHYSPGTDIWGGNSCIRVDGRGNKLSMKNCTLESRYLEFLLSCFFAI